MLKNIYFILMILSVGMVYSTKNLISLGNNIACMWRKCQ